METMLAGATVFSIFLTVAMTVVASKMLRENRARSAARVAALQALAAGPDAPEPAATGPETFDFSLRQTIDHPVDHPLFEATTPRTPGRRWPWIAACGVLIATVAGALYVASFGLPGRAAEPAAIAKTVASSASPIELLSLRHSIDPSGQFVVTGLVQNPGTSAAQSGVYAVVYLFDADGQYFASNRAAIESAVLSPGGESAFVVRVAAKDVSRYRVSFQHQDGAAVSHVDRRGALPESTTGDTVQAPPIVTARRN